MRTLSTMLVYQPIATFVLAFIFIAIIGTMLGMSYGIQSQGVYQFP